MPTPELNAPPFAVSVTARCAPSTTVKLVLFDRHIYLPFEGTGHEAQADRFVEAWTEHLDQAWVAVRETSAHIMGSFTKALRAEGVSDAAISAAMEAVRKDAEA